jgi:hypothetical protein
VTAIEIGVTWIPIGVTRIAIGVLRIEFHAAPILVAFPQPPGTKARVRTLRRFPAGYTDEGC